MSRLTAASVPEHGKAVCYNNRSRRPSTQKLQHIRSPLTAIESSVSEPDLLLLRSLRRMALESSLKVYLVGGPVRDALLGSPIKDLDFVVEGDAPELARQLAGELGGRVLVHDRFGTATVSLNYSSVDLVTARRESYPHPGALPEVTPGTIHEDLARRDFSLNSLALPLMEKEPRVLDPQGGMDDISNGFIRALHENSFVDDPTRILRAIRYEQRLGFRVEARTLAWLHQAVAGGYMARVTGDRLRHELARMLGEERPAPVLVRAIGLGVLSAIHPRLGPGGDVCRLAASLPGSSPSHPRPSGAGGALDSLMQWKPDYWLYYLAALAYRLSPEEGEGLLARLHLPNSWAGPARDAIELRLLEPELAASDLADAGLWGLLEGRSEAAIFAVSRITASPVVGQRLERYLGELRYVAPVLKGGDLLEMCVPEGPLVGRILRALRDAKLDRRVATEEEERDLVLTFLAPDPDFTPEGGQQPHD